MKHLFLILLASCSLGAAAQNKTLQKPATDTAQKVQVVEASCGQCRFGLKGEGCTLAVRMGDKAYFVDGSHIDEHGDAHATDGFCNAIRKAEVRGKVANDRFVATYFKLLPATAPQK
jgi:hypothetical protein